MKQNLLLLLLILKLNFFYAQSEHSFRAGEWLKFKLSYSGWVKAGYSTLHVKETYYNTFGNSLQELNTEGVEIIPQTMAPFPWHFGGQRYQNLFV